jgi:hypothetical protein
VEITLGSWFRICSRSRQGYRCTLVEKFLVADQDMLQIHIIEKPTIMQSCVFFLKIAGEY